MECAKLYYLKNYVFNPISRKRSSRYSPAVASSYTFGWMLSMQLSRQRKLILDFGCRKKGIENLEVCQNSLGGFTTLCVVLRSLLFCKTLQHIANIYHNLFRQGSYWYPFILFSQNL